MCGIAVILSRKPRPLANMLQCMAMLIRHRGPDDEGYWQLDASGDVHTGFGADTPALVRASALPWTPTQHINEEVPPAKIGMAHRRLAIVDPSPHGHQPMSWANGRYWISYNGEIYNYCELRQELEALGHRFSSQSDTEIVLAAYSEWGVSCLARFNGMWAFAIVDIEAGNVFIARDRFGVKPLYYCSTEDGIVALASEIKQFTALQGWQARVNAQRVHDFLVWNVLDHTDETLFDRVFQLPAGSCATFKLDAPMESILNDGRLVIMRWYTLPTNGFTGTYVDAVAEFKSILADSVQLRLRADVPVGSCLSGGLDSSSIVCLMGEELARAEGSPPTVFSAVFDEASVDEQHWADMVVNQTTAVAARVQPALENLFDQLPEITWHQDEPFCSTSIFAQWSVYQLVGEKRVRVILNGQGADEMLAGYHSFFAPRLVALLRKGQLLELTREISAMKSELGYSTTYAIQRMADMLLPSALRQIFRRLADRPSSMRNPWLSNSFCESANINLLAGIGQQSASIQELSRSLLLHQHLPMLLHCEDRNSMAHSVESRVPFLDYRLVELCLSLTDEFKLHRGLTKRVMRTAMAGTIPEPIRLRRDKIGFATPEHVWMCNSAPQQFRDALRKAIGQTSGILTPDALRHFDEMIEGKQAFSFLPWRMISLGAWIERFDVKA